MGEILDIYDENLVKLGSKDREAVHRDGDWHRVFQCWITYQRGGEGYLVMQRRAAGKQFYPNLLDTSAAGHYTSGETIQDGLREVREELGIDATFDQLIPLGSRVGIARKGNLVDHEVADVFLLVHDKDIREYHLQPEEVSGVVTFKIEDALAYLAGQRQSIPALAVGHGSETVELDRADFIPTIDRYLEKILVVARSYHRGESPLVI